MKHNFFLTLSWSKTATYFLLLLALFFLGLSAFAPILSPFLLGWTMAYILRPAVQWCHARGVPTLGASALLTLVLYVLVALIVGGLVPSLKNLLTALATYLPMCKETLWGWFHEHIAPFSQELQNKEAITESISGLLNTTTQWIMHTFTNILQNSWEVARLCGILLISPLICFHFMKDWEKMQHKTLTLVPPRYRQTFTDTLEEVNKALSGYFRGQCAVSAVLSLYYALTLGILGLEFGVLVGVLTGLFSFIPYVGFITGFFSAGLLIISQYGAGSKLMWCGVIYVFGYILEGAFLTPGLIGNRIGLHPIVVLFAVFAGGALRGLTGIFLALPLATVLAALWRIMRKRYITGTFYGAETLPSGKK